MESPFCTSFSIAWLGLPLKSVRLCSIMVPWRLARRIHPGNDSQETTPRKRLPGNKELGMYGQAERGLLKGMNPRITLVTVVVVAISLIYGAFYTERLAHGLAAARLVLDPFLEWYYVDRKSTRLNSSH